MFGRSLSCHGFQWMHKISNLFYNVELNCCQHFRCILTKNEVIYIWRKIQKSLKHIVKGDFPSVILFSIYFLFNCNVMSCLFLIYFTIFLKCFIYHSDLKFFLWALQQLYHVSKIIYLFDPAVSFIVLIIIKRRICNETFFQYLCSNFLIFLSIRV